MEGIIKVWDYSSKEKIVSALTDNGYVIRVYVERNGEEMKWVINYSDPQ